MLYIIIQLVDVLFLFVLLAIYACARTLVHSSLITLLLRVLPVCIAFNMYCTDPNCLLFAQLHDHTQQAVELSALDAAAPATLCFWLNIYHTLVRHALQLFGAGSSSREWASIQSNASYQVYI
jgi:hypothetical protein